MASIIALSSFSLAARCGCGGRRPRARGGPCARRCERCLGLEPEAVGGVDRLRYSGLIATARSAFAIGSFSPLTRACARRSSTARSKSILRSVSARSADRGRARALSRNGTHTVSFIPASCSAAPGAGSLCYVHARPPRQPEVAICDLRSSSHGSAKSTGSGTRIAGAERGADLGWSRRLARGIRRLPAEFRRQGVDLGRDSSAKPRAPKLLWMRLSSRSTRLMCAPYPRACEDQTRPTAPSPGPCSHLPPHLRRYGPIGRRGGLRCEREVDGHS